jgi:hypothetical protein
MVSLFGYNFRLFSNQLRWLVGHWSGLRRIPLDIDLKTIWLNTCC